MRAKAAPPVMPASRQATISAVGGQIELCADDTGNEFAEEKLPLNPDIEQAGVKGDRNRKTRDQQRDHLNHHFRDGRAAAQRAAEQGARCQSEI